MNESIAKIHHVLYLIFCISALGVRIEHCLSFLKVDYGSSGNVVEAKAKAEAARRDQWSVFSVQTGSLSMLYDRKDNQSFNPSVL